MARFDGQFLQEIKGKLDVELLGVASLEELHSEELTERATALLPGTKSVVVLGKEIFREVVALAEPSKGVGEAAYGDLLGPHDDYLNGRLTRAVHELASIFQRDGFGSLPLPARGCPLDERSIMAVFSYRHAAEMAGLGTIGRHSLLITPEFGPRVRLACVVTEAPLGGSSAVHEDYCTGCDVCIRECPAYAIQVPGEGEAYSINKHVCQAYRRAGLYCSVCMKACDEVLG